MNRPSVTAFAETAVVYAVIEGRTDEARRLLGNMLDDELRDYHRQVSTVLDLVNDEGNGRRLEGGF